MVGLILGRVAWNDRNAGRRHQTPRVDLRTHVRDDVRRRTDENQAGVDAGAREPRVLRQESVARMHGVGTRRSGGFEQTCGREVAVAGGGGSDRDRPVGRDDMRRGGVGIRVNRDALDSHLPTGTDDAQGDFAPVRDQQALDHDQRAFRFSRKACKPSCPSGETRRSAIAFVVIALASSTLRLQTAGISAFAAATASGPALANSLR